MRSGRFHYLVCWPGDDLIEELIGRLCGEAGVACRSAGQDLRLRQAGFVRFAFNYGPSTIDLAAIGAPVDPRRYLIGARNLPPHDVAAWKIVLPE